MLKFDALKLNFSPNSGFDPLETLISYQGEEGVRSVDAGFEPVADGWASLGARFGDQGFGDLLFGADGFGSAAASDSTGEFASTPAYTAFNALMGGLGDYGDRIAALQDDSGSGETAADNAPAMDGSDVMVIGGVEFAKGGNGKNKNGDGGGGGGGDTTESGVLKDYTSGIQDDALSGFNIDINFKGGDWTVDLQQEFLQAAELLSSIIYGDIQDVFFRGKIIDDIVITAELMEIDGPGGILGRAGPTAIRTDGYLPATAIMEFDIADAGYFDTEGLWGEIVFHEMMHSIGFGTVWKYLGLVDNPDDGPAVFKGAHAQAANGGDVLIEEDGGSGTALSHWDEDEYITEIMTGYLYTNYGTENEVEANIDTDLAGNLSFTDSGSDLSNMTIASLQDLGYETIWTGDEYLFA